MSPFSIIYNTLDKFSSSFVLFKNPSAIFLSLVNDKNDLENTIAPGKSFILFFKYFFIFITSSLDILLPLYNISLFDVIGNDSNLTPSYNNFI